MLLVRLTDGRVIVVDPKVSPLLHRASRKQLAKFQILNDGEGLIWPGLDEALSVRGFLQQVSETPQLVSVLSARRSRRSAAHV